MSEPTIAEKLEAALESHASEAAAHDALKDEHAALTSLAEETETRAVTAEAAAKVAGELVQELRAEVVELTAEKEKFETETAKLAGMLAVEPFSDISAGAEPVQDIAASDEGTAGILADWESVRGTREASTFWRDHKDEIIKAGAAS